MIKQSLLKCNDKYILGDVTIDNTVVTSQNMFNIIIQGIKTNSPNRFYPVATMYGVTYLQKTDKILYKVEEVGPNTFSEYEDENRLAISKYSQIKLLSNAPNNLVAELNSIILSYNNQKREEEQRKIREAQRKKLEEQKKKEQNEVKWTNKVEPNLESEKLREKNNELEKENISLKEKLKDLESNSNSNVSELSKLENKNKELLSENNNLSEKVKDLDVLIIDKNAEILSLTNRNKDLEEENSSLKSKIAELESKLETIQSERNKIIETTPQAEALKSIATEAKEAKQKQEEENQQTEQSISLSEITGEKEQNTEEVQYQEKDKINIAWDEPQEKIKPNQDSPVIKQTMIDKNGIVSYICGELPENTLGQEVSITGTTKEFMQEQINAGKKIIVPFVTQAPEGQVSKFDLEKKIQSLINNLDLKNYDQTCNQLYNAMYKVFTKFGDNVNVDKLIKTINETYTGIASGILYELIRLDVMEIPNKLYNGVPYIAYIINLAYQLERPEVDDSLRSIKAFDAIRCYISTLDSEDDIDLTPDDFNDYDSDSEEDVSGCNLVLSTLITAETLLGKYLDEQLYELEYNGNKTIHFANFQVLYTKALDGETVKVPSNQVLDNLGLKGIEIDVRNNGLKMYDTMGIELLPTVFAFAAYKDRINKNKSERYEYNDMLEVLKRNESKTLTDDLVPNNVFSKKIQGLMEAQPSNEKVINLQFKYIIAYKTENSGINILGWGLEDTSDKVLISNKMYFIPVKSRNFISSSVNIVGLNEEDLVKTASNPEEGVWVSQEKYTRMIKEKSIRPIKLILTHNQTQTLTGEEVLDLVRTNIAMKMSKLLPMNKEEDLKMIEKTIRSVKVQ